MQSRGTFVKAGTGVAICVLVQPSAVLAQSDSLTAVVRAYAGTAPLQEGRVKLEIAPRQFIPAVPRARDRERRVCVQLRRRK